jgi:hypothetical protein
MRPSVTHVTQGHNPPTTTGPAVCSIGAVPSRPTRASLPPTTFRLAPAVVARLVGLALVLAAVLVFAGTALVAGLDLPADLLVVLVVVCVGGIGLLAWWLRNRAWVLSCTREGYVVRLVRGAGEKQARWAEVEDAVTTTRHDVPCVVLRLRDGRTTTIPVGVLAVDKEQFVRELQERLQLARGLRPYEPEKRPD